MVPQLNARQRVSVKLRCDSRYTAGYTVPTRKLPTFFAASGLDLYFVQVPTESQIMPGGKLRARVCRRAALRYLCQEEQSWDISLCEAVTTAGSQSYSAVITITRSLRAANLPRNTRLVGVGDRLSRAETQHSSRLGLCTSIVQRLDSFVQQLRDATALGLAVVISARAA